MSELKQNIRKISTQNSSMLLVFLVITLVLSMILSTLKEIGILGEEFHAEMLVSGVVQYLVALPLSMLIMRSSKNGKSIPSLKETFRKPQATKKEIAKWIMISLFLTYAMSYVSNAIFTILQTLTEIELHAIDFSADNTILGKLTTILVMMFLAPLFEEILFRAIMLKNSEKYGTWSGVIALGVMFGLFHLNFQQTLYTAVLGICTGFLVIKTKSIFPSILLHFCLNTVGAMQSISISGLDLEQISAGNEQYIAENIISLLPFLFMELLIVAIMIIGLVFFILELTNHKETFHLENECPELSELQKLGIYFTTPSTMILTILLTIGTIFNAVG